MFILYPLALEPRACLPSLALGELFVWNWGCEIMYIISTFKASAMIGQEHVF